MMFRCTFTGLDEFVSLNDVASLSKKFSFLEWGILFSSSENKSFGRNRYPSFNWIESHISELSLIRKETGISLALHVCGKEVKNLLSNQGFVSELIKEFDRVQINFRYKDHKFSDIIDLMKRNQEIIFITQHNNANKDLWAELKEPNHQVLFDKSGGRGIETEDWESPLLGKVCGYAGGLGVDNISNQLDRILPLVKGDFWIDMEGKIRTDDKLDLSLCEKVATNVRGKLSFLQLLN